MDLNDLFKVGIAIETSHTCLHRMAPKQHGPLQVQSYPIYFYYAEVPQSPTFHSASLSDHLFLSYRPPRDKCAKLPKMTFNTTRSKVSHMCYHCPGFSTTTRLQLTSYFVRNPSNHPKMPLDATRSKFKVYQPLSTCEPVLEKYTE